jgi:TonB family protein
VHLSIFLAVLFLPRVFGPKLDFPDIYTVNLVSLPAGTPGPSATAAPGPPAPAVEKKAPAPAPAPAVKAPAPKVKVPPAPKPKPAIKIPENPTVKPTKPKPAAKTPVVPKPQPEETAAESQESSAAEEGSESGKAEPQEAAGKSAPPAGGLTGGGAGQLGSGAGGGGGMLDDATFQYGWYLSNMSSLFSRNWTRPIKPDLSRTLRAVVHFVIQKDGRITEIVMEQSSGDAALDRSALRAVQDSNPLPPLPYQYGKDSLGVHFFFDIVPD